jgi:dihydrolipoamide dehydrogenase
MSAEVLDIIVIGGGVGGYVAGLRAARLGARVALVEKHLIGGTCLNIGCIPTKALLESCKVLRVARKGSEFGIRIEEPTPDSAAIAARSKSIVGVMRKGVEDLLTKGGIAILRGSARLTSANDVEVTSEAGTQVMKAKSIVIATGSRWLTLPGVEVDGEMIITSDHALDLTNTEGSMVVIGAGAVGCEFAEIYSALGTQVTIIEMMDQVLPGEDSELARRLEASLKRKGIRIMTGSKVASVEQSGHGVVVAIEGGESINADRVLMGIGRRPNTEDMGLEAVGVALERNAIRTDDGMRTSVSNIYAVGDVTGKYMLAHVALAQGIVAAENACGRDSHIDYTAVPRCVYTDPEHAAVGLTEAQAAAQGLRVRAQKVRLGRIGRALTLGETFGLAKIVVEDGSGKVVGFHALAPHASEVLSEVSLAIGKGMTAADIGGVIHPHPTLSEIVWECAEAVEGKAIHGD